MMITFVQLGYRCIISTEISIHSSSIRYIPHHLTHLLPRPYSFTVDKRTRLRMSIIPICTAVLYVFFNYQDINNQARVTVTSFGYPSRSSTSLVVAAALFNIPCRYAITAPVVFSKLFSLFSFSVALFFWFLHFLRAFWPLFPHFQFLFIRAPNIYIKYVDTW